MRFADLDAVTIDAFGTLVALEDPIPNLREALRERGVERSRERIEAAFHTEADYYRSHLSTGRDPESLQRLRVDCTAVFLRAADVDLAAEEFAPAYVASLSFHVLEGVREALGSLRARGLELAVVGNWDVGLHDYLERLQLATSFRVVLPVARKPDPERLLEALALLGVSPRRALHIGDDSADEAAAGEAEMSFLPAPLIDAVTQLS